MPLTQPEERIRFTQKEVGRYQEDVEEWKQAHESLRRDCWFWEKLIGKANRLFNQILDLDSDIRESVFSGEITAQEEERLHKEVVSLVQQWLQISQDFLRQVVRLEGEYGVVEGAQELRQHIKDAEGILTSDEQFFQGDELARLRDQAIDDHRAGRTEGFPHNAPTAP
jgi:hypothetical protein